MNKKIRVLALLPILSVVLTACTLQDLPVIGKYFGGTDVSTEPVTLKVWGLWEDPAVIQSLINKYQEQHPNVTISYDDRSIMTLPEYKERIFARFQDPAAEVDIALIHNSWVSRLSTTLSPMPSELMDVATYESKFFPVVTASGIVGNEIKAIPAYYDGLVLVYNKDHFEEINQSLPPTAWEEFRRLALLLTVRGGEAGIVRAGAALGTADNIDHFSDILGLMWAQADVGVTPEMASKKHFAQLEQYSNLIGELDSRAAYDALTFYTNFAKEDRVWNGSFPEATAAFSQGKVSMIFVPSWQVLDIISVSPNANSIGVAPVPQAIPDDPRSWGTFWMYAVPNNTTKSAVAWDFLNFISQEEQQLMYFDEASKVRFFGTPYPVASLASGVSNPILAPVLQTAPYARSNEFAGRAGNITQVDALKTAVNSVLGGSSSETALKKVKETLSK